jgi:hypothetical protein
VVAGYRQVMRMADSSSPNRVVLAGGVGPLSAGSPPDVDLPPAPLVGLFAHVPDVPADPTVRDSAALIADLATLNTS